MLPHYFSVKKTVIKQVCAANKPTPVSINICPTTGPFCKSGFKNDYCDTTRDPARFMCQPLSFLFHCTDVGYFPDPIDCTAYYICVPVPSMTNHFNAERRSCDTGLIYNGNTRKCVVPNNSILCRTVNCEQSTSEFKTFPGYTQYFYNCVERSIRIPSGKIPVMYRCPGPTNVAFNSTSNTCYYNCNGWSQGRIAIPDKADEFYQCNYGSQALLESCPKPYLFSAARSICTNI